MLRPMIGFKKLSYSSIPWFSIGLTAIFLGSVVLRFWGLGRFNALVFDEVYYAKFANNYLTDTHFFNAHPPLSQYFIAIGMWIGSHLPFGQDNINGLTGSLHSTWSYRWLNALTGSFIPLVVAAIAYQLNRRRSYALIAAIFAAADGLFLVESRYALNNVYLVILGLLGQLYLLVALSQPKGERWRSLALSGIFFGSSACIKWNGLWFLLGVYLIWGVAWALRWRRLKVKNQESRGWLVPWSAAKAQHSKLFQTPLVNLTEVKVFPFLLNFALIPVLTYSFLWIPHLIMNPNPGFWEAQYKILTFHEKIGDGPNVHPYCSRWYTWILMLRPVAYFYQTAQSINEQVPAYPPLPSGTGKIIYDVHAMGNPILWWLSTAAILLLLLLLVQRLWLGWRGKFLPTTVNYMTLYLTFNWLANLLPWVKVGRCTFLYHYMGASVFSGLSLAWIVDRWLHSDRSQRQNAAIAVIGLILLAFVFWLPIYLGLPLSFESYHLRMWFRSWI
ncbi:dolichyl-phosphate-mannose--protein mannosyltransferase [Coleofasciculus sp. LEGE 07092]|uniref:dolichyl-phosphate-mannose--protein mannosyltransferase n=2 Tax=unclassified Coleofasciculus TaxID=2692782 RepID=UPI002AD5B0AF|nr:MULTISPECIES: phospholipid carrier-dependent glycosyltransferase [unclassified Coleofasciculus]